LAELPQDFEKSFLDLMDEYKSDQSSKLKRNIDILSFSIIAANFIGLKFADIKFLGADLKNVCQPHLEILVVFILLFWLSLLTGYIYKDEKHNKERKFLLEKSIKVVSEYREIQKKALEDKKNNEQMKTLIHGRFNDVDNQYQIYCNQLERTKEARVSQKILKYVEYIMPYILSVIAIVIIIIGE